MTQEDRIKYADEIARIEGLDINDILTMDSKFVWRVTDGFQEPLVRLLFTNTYDIDEQRELIQSLKTDFKTVCIEFSGSFNESMYPDYFDDLEYDIQCNRLITSINARKPLPPINIPHVYPTNQQQHIVRANTGISSEVSRIKELEAENSALRQQLKEQTAKGNDLLKEEFERLKQKREDMIVELLLPAFYNIDADARSFVRKIDNGMDSEGVAEVTRQFLQEKKITPSKKGRDIWKVLHAAKLYDRVEQSWTREMRKA